MALVERMSDYRILEINANNNTVSLTRDFFIDKDDVCIMSNHQCTEVVGNDEITALIAKILEVAVNALPKE